MKFLKQTRIQAILFNILIFPLSLIFSIEYLALNGNSFNYPSSFFINSFMHAGIIHLFFNMLVTYQFGEIVDHIYQKKERYFLYFILAIPITICMFIYISLTNPNLFLVGYSGVAMALIGACFRFLERKQKLFIGGQLILFHALIIFFAPTVSWEAHLVGFIIGSLYSYNRFLFKQPQNLPEDTNFKDERSISNF